MRLNLSRFIAKANASLYLLMGTLACLLLTMPAPLVSQTLDSHTTQRPNRITQEIDSTRLVTLRGNVRADLTAERDQGPVEDQLPLHLYLVLQRTPEQQTALDNLLARQQQPTAPEYHQWLTPQEYGERFGVSPQDISKISSWLESRGMHVNGAMNSGMFIEFSATARDVREVFHSPLHYYNIRGGKYAANAQDPVIPAALAPVVAGIQGLSKIPLHSHHSKIHPTSYDPVTHRWDSLASVSGEASPAYNYGSGAYPVTPQDFYTIYNVNRVFSGGNLGATATVAVIEESDIEFGTVNGTTGAATGGDVATFRRLFGVPGTLNMHVYHGYGSVPCNAPGIDPYDSGEEVEAALDAEWANALAPSANLIFMSCDQSLNNGIFSSMMALIDNNLADVMSLSYGDSELAFTSSNYSWQDALYSQAAAQGQSFIVSSGDSGSDVNDQNTTVTATSGINVNAFGAPNVTVAGGTDFSDLYDVMKGGPSQSAYWSATNSSYYGDALGYVPETPWNNSCASSLLAAYEGYSGAGYCGVGPGSDPFIDGDVVGGSGGFSTHYTVPAYQSGITGYSGTMRAQPDISGMAANGLWGHWLIFCDSYAGDANAGNVPCTSTSTFGGAGGTSFVAPYTAGITGLLVSSTGSRQGLLNPALYALAKGQFTAASTRTACYSNGQTSNTGVTTGLPAASCIFNDVTTGNNDVPCAAGSPNCYVNSGNSYGMLSLTNAGSLTVAYPSTPGYDEATGIGTVNVYNLIANWNTAFTSTTALTASPTSISPSGSTSLTATVTSGAPTGSTYTPALSGLVSFAAGSTALGNCTLSGGSCSLSVSGSALQSGANSVTATFIGSNSYPASTSSIVAVTVAGLSAQTITFPNPGTQSYSATPITLTATASSGLGVSYAVTSGPATVSGNALTITGVGSVTVQGSQAGNANYTAATPVSVSFTVNKATQTITFPYVGTQTYPVAPITLTATASSGLAVSYSVNSGPATLSGNTLTVTGTGVVTVQATQAGNTNYSAAVPVIMGFIVKQAQTITFPNPGTQSYGVAPITLQATASSGLAVSYAVTSGFATVSGSTLTITGAGTVTVQASQAGNSNYFAATPVSVSFSVNLNPYLSGLSPNSATPGSAAFTLTISGSNFASGAVAKWNGSALTTTYISATQLTAAVPASLVSTAGTASVTVTTGVGGSNTLSFAVGAGIISSLAGNGNFGYTGDGSPATSLELYEPYGVAIDASGNLYIADTYNDRIRKVTPGGTITTIVGNGTAGYAGDGAPATSAEIYFPEGVAIDASGNLYLTDSQNDRIRKVTPGGTITTIAGNGTAGFTGDGGPATSAEVNGPWGVAIDASGNLYFADANNNRIRKITPGGTITTLASGFDEPRGIAVDASGNVYVADTFNGAIRKVTPGGTVTTVAGNGGYAYTGDGGPATSAELAYPDGVAVDAAGNLYIADSGNARIRKVTPGGTITTLAGNGTRGYTGDGGPATSAEIHNPIGVAVDAHSNVYIADADGEVVRKVTSSIPFISNLSPSSAMAGGVDFTLTINGSNFTSGSVAMWGSTALTTTYVSASNLTAAVPASLIATAGTASVTVTTTGGTSAAATFTINPASQTITFPNPGTQSYGVAPITLSATASSGLAVSYAVTSGPATVSGSTLTITGAGSVTVQATQTGNGNYSAAAPVSVTFTVNPEAQTITFPNPGTQSYGVTPITLSATASSGLAVSYSVTSGPATVSGSTLTVTGAGSVTVQATQAGNANYAAATPVSVTFTINKATPSVSFTGAPASAPYHSSFTVVASTNASTAASITASGACSIAGTTVTVTASMGTCSLNASWATDSNYLAASATQSTTATKATPAITWATPVAITYGTALSVTQLDAKAAYNGTTVAGTFVYESAGTVVSAGKVLAAGSQTLSVTFTPSTANAVNYTSNSATVVLPVNQATSKIIWAKPVAITYGTEISGTQLDATTSVPGTRTYSPAAGTVLTGGSHTLSVAFAPTDAVDYTPSTATVTITVNKAAPTITWPEPSAIAYGTALSGTQLNATGTVPGSFAYSPALGTKVAGGSQTLKVTFTPTDATDYATKTASVTLQVNASMPTLTWAEPAAITYGTKLSALQLNAKAAFNGAAVTGTYVYTPALGTVLGAGPQTLSVVFTPTSAADYNTPAAATVTLQVNKATPKITWVKPAAITYGTALSGTQLDAITTVPGTSTYSSPAGTVLTAGTQMLSATFTPTDTADYNTASLTTTVTVNKAAPAVSWTTPAAIAYGTALSGTQLNASASVPGSFSYTPALGKVLAGGSQALKVTFTPTDTTDYATENASVTLQVNSSTPTITWLAPAAIPYGTKLSTTQLNAKATFNGAAVAGTFVYTPAIGTLLGAGSQTLSVVFTPTSAADYTTPAASSVTLYVNPATPKITWAVPAAITYRDYGE